MSKLLQRVVTAAILLVVLLIVFFRLPQPAAIGVLGIFVAVAAWEWSAFLPLIHFFPRAVYTLFLVGLMAGALWVFPEQIPLQPLLWAGLLWWSVAFIWLLRFPTKISPVVGAVCGVFVIVPAWVALVILLAVPGRGPEYVLFVLMIVWAADIGAYFVGRRLGRAKLAPKISPGKTWEGFGGGMVGAIGIALCGSWWFDWSPWFLIPLAVSVTAISVVGDLTVSMFKRNAGLKDSGNLFPGHGGVLDRVDSVTAAVPLFALEVTWIGLFAY
jgi:phosphatidate cytidylyltransferase